MGSAVPPKCGMACQTEYDLAQAIKHADEIKVECIKQNQLTC